MTFRALSLRFVINFWPIFCWWLNVGKSVDFSNINFLTLICIQFKSKSFCGRLLCLARHPHEANSCVNDSHKMFPYDVSKRFALSCKNRCDCSWSSWRSKRIPRSLEKVREVALEGSGAALNWHGEKRFLFWLLCSLCCHKINGYTTS